MNTYIPGGFGGYVGNDASGTLRASSGRCGGGSETLICRAGGQVNSEEYTDLSPAETAHQYKDPHFIYGTERVRRLTPLECERLQGFPDGWTDIPYKGKEHPPDSPRYKALGNSFAVPVVRWIGERIQMASDIIEGGKDA